MDQIGPFNPIHRIAFIVFYFHEPVTFNKALFMKKVGVALIVYHPYPAAVFRHEHVHITIERVAMVSASDYFRYTLSLAAHVVELGQIEKLCRPLMLSISPPVSLPVSSAPDSLSPSSVCKDLHASLWLPG